MVDEYLSVPEYFGGLPPGDADRARREPDGRRAPDRRRRRARARDRAHGCVALRAAAGAGTVRADRRVDGRAGRDAHALRRGALPVLRARAHRARREGLEYEPVEIDLGDRPAWIYEKNATGRVPVVEEDGWLLPESAVIMEYLEERYPEPALLPADPADRALARLWIFRHDEFTRPYYALRRGEEDAAARLDAELGKLDARSRERPCLGGTSTGSPTSPTFRGCCVRGHARRRRSKRIPALAAWLERLVERPSVAMEVDVVAAL